MCKTSYRWYSARGGSSAVLLQTFAAYWLCIYPVVRRELDRWHLRARSVPNSAFREIAHGTILHEGLNAEGAALFAVLAPRATRRAAATLVVRFQILYDYLDALTEQPVREPVRTSRQLHCSLIAALGGPVPAAGYFAHHPHGDDGGYLAELVAACRAIFRTLPSAARAAPHAIRAARRSAEGQSQSHAATFTTPNRLIAWATRTTPAGSDLYWWETAAAAESSLGIHALLASAADPHLSVTDAERIAAAYWPWITGLNALLDDLIDTAEDAAEGTHSYVTRYRGRDLTAQRLGVIAAQARRAIDGLPLRHRHATILAAMTSFYLAAPHAADAEISPAARRVREEIGYDLRPLLAMLRIRRAVAASRGQARHVA
jgi:tetraprenyl-beta-curcumene synthase